MSAPGTDSSIERNEGLIKLDNLSAAQYRAGNFKESVELLRKALSIREQCAAEKNSTDVLNNMNNLAAALGRLKRLDEAEAMFRTVLARREIKLGCEHMDTLVTANYLGVIVKQKKRLKEAEELMCRALEGFRKLEAAGCPPSPIFAETAYNYAILCVQLGQRKRAGKYFGIAHRGLTAELGTDNPHTLDALDWEIRCMSSADFTNRESLSNAADVPDVAADGTVGRDEEDGGAAVQDSLIGDPVDGDDEEMYKSAAFGVSAKQCELCNRTFKLTSRRHHCRICARAVCHSCSPGTTVTQEHSLRAVRCCSTCERQGF